ncbi:hypothetical protein F443_00498 [Phytophthora nicotianae P1569]|uniref:Uncharacterized protein n=1 Tax=Phytophthora nicotianae P1569 TaxID=1317065 RepID=V9G2R5_PHYNI|nr:hypothetical protein F443_00498 [Phytophthora nicotianae P1569]
MAALRSAVIEDYYDEDFDEDYESECEYDRRDENDAYASGSTLACSEFEGVRMTCRSCIQRIYITVREHCKSWINL